MSTNTDSSKKRDKNLGGSPLAAALTGIGDMLKKKERIGTLSSEERLDGKVCLVTGSSSGLGKAAAIELARRGGRIIMASRSRIPEAAEEVKKKSGSSAVEMYPLDLTDFQSVLTFCSTMKKKNIVFDRAVFNAGVVPGHSRKTRDGFEEMFQVNYLAKYLLVNKLLQDGTIPNSVFSENAQTNGDVPRIVFTLSEVHRNPESLDLSRFGEFREYSMAKSMEEYGYSKLLAATFFNTLAEKLRSGSAPEVSVFALCPGAVNSNIARDVPKILQPFLKVAFTLFFKSPARAAEPIVFFCCSADMEGKTGRYLHVMAPKEIAPAAKEPGKGDELWQMSRKLVPVD